jgi:hypothetical protein
MADKMTSWMLLALFAADRLTMTRIGAVTMQLTIRIECDSAAFEDDPIGEIERVLKQLVFRLGDDRYATERRTSGKLFDSTGCPVGEFVLSTRRENPPDVNAEQASGNA